MNGYVVTVTFDPTDPRGMRWSYEIRNERDRYEHDGSMIFSRRAAERQARRYLKRKAKAGGFSYSFTVPPKDES